MLHEQLQKIKRIQNIQLAVFPDPTHAHAQLSGKYGLVRMRPGHRYKTANTRFP